MARMTSGARLEPPMPSRTAERYPSARSSCTNSVSPWTSSRTPSKTLSQPRALATIFWWASSAFHSVGSAAQRRSEKSAAASATRRSCTAASSSARPTSASFAGEQVAALLLDDRYDLLERLREQLHALDLELGAHALHVDAQLAELAKCAVRVVEVTVDRPRERAVVVEGLPGDLGQGVHGVLADELVHVQHVGVGGVLGAGARPQDALHLGARGGDELPVAAAKVAAKALVDDLGVGHRGRALERFEPPPLRHVGAGGLDPLVQQPVDQRVDARHEEARHRRRGADREIVLQSVLERLEVGVGDGLVLTHREQEGDVDVEALPQRLEDRRHALAGAGDLDHHVGAVHGGEKALGLGDGLLRVVGIGGRDLDGDEAVLAAAAQIHGREHVAGGAHVFDRQAVEDLLRAQALAREPQDLLVVARPGAHGLLEDGRVAGDAAEAVAVDHPPETAAGHKIAADVVEPGALSESMKLGQTALSRAWHRRHTPFASRAFARA